MYLKRTQMIFEYNNKDLKYGSHFNYHAYVIGYYLSKMIRKDKYETDGSFDTVVIQIGSPQPTELMLECLTVTIPYDKKLYDSLNDKERCYYYCELYRTGLQKASEIKILPLAELFFYLDTLAQHNFVYEWNFKNLYVRDYNLRIVFTSDLTTNDYVLRLTAFDKKKKKIVCEGQVLRTPPDDIHYNHISKKMPIVNGEIIIQTHWDTQLFSINIENLMKGRLEIKYLPAPFPDNELHAKAFYYNQKSLQYDNNDFEQDIY